MEERPDALGGRGEDELLAPCEALLLTGEELAGSLGHLLGDIEPLAIGAGVFALKDPRDRRLVIADRIGELGQGDRVTRIDRPEEGIDQELASLRGAVGHVDAHVVEGEVPGGADIVARVGGELLLGWDDLLIVRTGRRCGLFVHAFGVWLGWVLEQVFCAKVFGSVGGGLGEGVLLGFIEQGIGLA